MGVVVFCIVRRTQLNIIDMLFLFSAVFPFSREERPVIRHPEKTKRIEKSGLFCRRFSLKAVRRNISGTRVYALVFRSSRISTLPTEADMDLLNLLLVVIGEST